MRLLPTAALVLVSLTFTVGGVAIVGQADSDSAAQTPAATSAAQPAQQQCATPKPIDGHVKAQRLAAAPDTVPLNTRGYNYGLPGDPQPDLATPPAAPAKP